MDSTRFGHCPKLSENVKDVFRELCQAVADLHRKWRFYLDLFGEEENLDLLNRRAPAAFAIIEQSLRHEITMGISRINDPKVSFGKYENLSLANLCDRVGPNSSIETMRAAFETACKPFKDFRDKRVGHNDLKTALGHPDTASTGICRQDVEHCLALAAKLLNNLYQAAGGEESLTWSFQVLEVGGGKSLVECLQLADRLIMEERQQLFLRYA